jgi:hypothetical protein
MKTPDQLCIVYSTLQWLRAARLHAAEAKKSGRPIWIAVDGTGETICEKKRNLLLCTLTTAHTMVIIAVAVVGTENKVALRFFLRKVKEAMERMYPDFDWDVDYVMSDGATGIGSSAKKIWPELKAWLQCLFHVIRPQGKPGRCCCYTFAERIHQ